MKLWLVVAIVGVVLLVLWPVTPTAMGRLVARLVGYVRVLPKAKRNRTGLARWLIRRPSLLGVNYAYEGAVVFANGTDARLKYLAGLKASALAGCPF